MNCASRIAVTIENIEHVGTSPALWSGLFGALADGEVEVSELARLLEREPTLCAQVLRLANSAYYSRGKSIDTIAQAVVHLGLDMTRRVVLAVNLIGLYHNRCGAGGFDDARFWKHTLAGAFLAQAMAVSSGFLYPVQLYVAALLRDIGVLVFRQYFPDLFMEALDLAQRQRVPFSEAVEKICGIGHREVSVLIGRRWNLPETILGPLGEGTAGDATSREGGMLIRMADAILFEREYELWDPFARDSCDPADCLVRGMDQRAKDALFAGAQGVVQGIADQIVF